MTNSQKRDVVAHLYPSRAWASRVAKMSDAQVHAIYMWQQEKPKKSQANNG